MESEAPEEKAGFTSLGGGQAGTESEPQVGSEEACFTTNTGV